jgi:hypothetical protein
MAIADGRQYSAVVRVDSNPDLHARTSFIRAIGVIRGSMTAGLPYARIFT